MNIVPYGTFTAPALVNGNALQASGVLADKDTQNTFVDNMLGLSEYTRRSDLLSDMLAQPAQYLQTRQAAITNLIDRTKQQFRRQYKVYFLYKRRRAGLGAPAVVEEFGANVNVTQALIDRAKKELIPEYKAKKLAIDDALSYFQTGMAYINEAYPTEFGELAFEIGGAKSAASKGADIAAMREALNHLQGGSV